jgi:hypothetical protein
MNRLNAFLLALAFGAVSGLVAFVVGDILVSWVCGLACGMVTTLLNVLTHPNVRIG